MKSEKKREGEEKGEPLPSLPVPQLETTMQKYLAQVEAICPSHLDKCKLLVKAFLAGPGPKLQQQLLERQQTTINWSIKYPMALVGLLILL
ncbi:hypothetical protein PV325_006187 [Microctonus aethiopoides]|nr:hypothetical protein PV325_006187 [Microctonus aethiopoides]